MSDVFSLSRSIVRRADSSERACCRIDYDDDYDNDNDNDRDGRSARDMDNHV